MTPVEQTSTPHPDLRAAAQWLVDIWADNVAIEQGSALWEDIQRLRAALSLQPPTTGGAMNNPEMDLRTLSDAASPGPWQWLDGDGESYDELQDGRGEQIATGFREDTVLDGQPINRDGSFAAAAANYVRAAIATARATAPDLRAALEAVIESWEDAIKVIDMPAPIFRTSVLDAMGVWPKGANGPIAISAYESLVERLREHRAVVSWAQMQLPAALGSDIAEPTLDACTCDHQWPCPAVERCDEPGCDREATCGWPTRPGGTGPNGGYRRTCGDHMRSARLSAPTDEVKP